MSRRNGHGGDLLSRPNPIFAASVVLAVLVVGGGLYLLLGRARPEMPVEPPATRTTSSAQDASRVALVPVPVPTPTKVPALAQPDAASPVFPTVSAAIRKRDVLVAAHVQQVIQEADERAFSRLQIPEDQRVAIRLLNERHAQRTQRDLAAQPDDVIPERQFGNTIAITENAERTRRAELMQLLGVAADPFLRAETAEVRRLQRRYRVQWADELEQNAPLPAGLPPRAH